MTSTANGMPRFRTGENSRAVDTDAAPFLDSLIKSLPLISRLVKISETENQLASFQRAMKDAEVVSDEFGNHSKGRIQEQLAVLAEEKKRIRAEPSFPEAEKAFRDAMGELIVKELHKKAGSSDFITRTDITNGTTGLATSTQVQSIKTQLNTLTDDVKLLKSKRDKPSDDTAADSSSSKKRKTADGAESTSLPLSSEDLAKIQQELRSEIQTSLLKVFATYADRSDHQSGMIAALSRTVDNLLKLLTEQRGDINVMVSKEDGSWGALQELWKSEWL